MRYVSRLACTICGTKFSAETPMESLSPRWPADPGDDGSRSPRGRVRTRRLVEPGSTRPLAVRGTASSRYQRRGRFPLDHHPGRGMHAVARVCSSSVRPRRFSFEVKVEGRHHRGFGANPTLSFKDRGMWLIERIGLQGRGNLRSLPPGHSPSAGGGVE